MSAALNLLSQLRAAGFTLAARDGKLIVTPASRLTPELTASIREHKPALLELLARRAHHAEDVPTLAGYLERRPPTERVQLHEVELVTWGDRTVALEPGAWEAFARDVAEYHAKLDQAASKKEAAKKQQQKAKQSKRDQHQGLFTESTA